jgi:LmbE family N-acetylglucosaminyl deacetylase
MSKQRRHGHEVYLLTLTRGGATRLRHKFGYSVDEMGEVRYKEMLDVAKTLGLTGMTVLDLPDSGLTDMDPREIETAIAAHIESIQPDVVVTYAVHGISGFFDHLINHAVVKRVFVELRERVSTLKRLAFFTLTEEEAGEFDFFHLTGSKAEDIDVVLNVDEIDIEANHRALDCYVTYQETIEGSGIKQLLTPQVVFEIYQEQHDPPLKGLFEGLAE